MTQQPSQDRFAYVVRERRDRSGVVEAGEHDARRGIAASAKDLRQLARLTAEVTEVDRTHQEVGGKSPRGTALVIRRPACHVGHSGELRGVAWRIPAEVISTARPTRQISRRRFTAYRAVIVRTWRPIQPSSYCREYCNHPHQLFV